MSVRAVSLGLVVLLLGGCMVGPDYTKPSVPMTADLQGDGWVEGRPAERSPAEGHAGGRSSAIPSSTRWRRR